MFSPRPPRYCIIFGSNKSGDCGLIGSENKDAAINTGNTSLRGLKPMTAIF